MSHSFCRIWVHSIWSTKDHHPFISSAIENQLFDIIRQEFLKIGCPVRIVNGMPDHVHCLFLLNPQKSIAEVIKQIKGSSSHIINQQDLITEKFAWQVGYGAFSVSESVLPKAYTYIKNQKQHHQKKSFQEEFDQFIKMYGLGKDKNSD